MSEWKKYRDACPDRRTGRYVLGPGGGVGRKSHDTCEVSGMTCRKDRCPHRQQTCTCCPELEDDMSTEMMAKVTAACPVHKGGEEE